MKKQVVSSGQMAMLAASFLASNTLIHANKSMVVVAGQDGWLGYFLPMLYGLLVSSGFILLSRGSSEPTLFEVNKSLLGMFGGNLVNLLLLGYFLVSISLDLRRSGEYVKNLLLVRTPLLVILFVIIALAVYVACAGAEVIARHNSLNFLLIFTSICLLPLLLLNEIDPSKLLPAFSSGIPAITRTSYMALGYYGEVMMIAMVLFSALSHTHQKGIHPLYKGVIMAGFLSTLLSVTTIMTLGVAITRNAINPSGFLTQMIHITDFLDRMDVFFMMIWLPAIILKICFVYFALCECLSSIGRHKQDPKAYAFVIGPLVCWSAIYSFPNVMKMFHFEVQVWPMINLLLPIPLILILLLAKRLRRKGRMVHDEEI